MRTLWLTAALLVCASRAHADTVVTMCARDTEVHKDSNSRNFADAMIDGGRITFKCGGRATIRITNVYNVVRATQIDGQGLITLDGLGKMLMFVGANDGLSFKLTDLAIVNAGSPPRVPAPGSKSLWVSGSVIRGRLKVELLRTSISRSQSPISLLGGSIRIEGSQFNVNEGVVVSARDITVLGQSQFSYTKGVAISGRGTVIIESSQFWANTQPSSFSDCTLRITGSLFTNHTAPANGGALRVNCDATIEESRFDDNVAMRGGAISIGAAPKVVSLRVVKFNTNRADSTGGAISVESSSHAFELQLRHVTFVDNRARRGGAIELDRQAGNNTHFLTGAAAAFVRNRAIEYGGAIYAPNASIKLSRGIFIQNQAAQSGGAIAALQQGPRSVELVNSLLVRNRASRGGAFWGNAAMFTNTTFSENGTGSVWAEALTPPPGSPSGTPARFPIRFVNTILSSDGSSVCGPSVAMTPYEDLGNNLQYPGTSCGASIASEIPWLGPYYLPWFWSPAINGGNNAVCEASPVGKKDLYNTRRPLTDQCTIGAVEASLSHLVSRWRNNSDAPDAATETGSSGYERRTGRAARPATTPSSPMLPPR